ncbi:DUF1543 domain-containing protein, partial [Francisella tularensis subsp. holarctica]|uniref:DUF1543 domain-containing protein n=1 Tax=Francisella tularensis TaxID=263 RepID=UPI0023819575
GYQISIQDNPQNADKKLYFVNLGGYDASKLNELHEFALLVYADKTEAKEKAKQSLLKNTLHQHTDNLNEVDDCLERSKVDCKYIHLTPSDKQYD